MDPKEALRRLMVKIQMRKVKRSSDLQLIPDWMKPDFKPAPQMTYEERTEVNRLRDLIMSEDAYNQNWRDSYMFRTAREIELENEEYFN